MYVPTDDLKAQCKQGNVQQKALDWYLLDTGSMTSRSMRGSGLLVCTWVVLGTTLDFTPAGVVLQQLWTKHLRSW